MLDRGKGKIHVMSEADQARRAAREAKVAKAAERERLRSDVVNQSARALARCAGQDPVCLQHGRSSHRGPRV